MKRRGSSIEPYGTPKRMSKKSLKLELYFLFLISEID